MVRAAHVQTGQTAELMQSIHGDNDLQESYRCLPWQDLFFRTFF